MDYGAYRIEISGMPHFFTFLGGFFDELHMWG